LTRSSLLNVLLLAVAFGWLLLFAHNGLWAQFTNDDLMNLHGHVSRGPAGLLLDNLRYWSTAYRPLGGVFYVGLYRTFGFHPLPFRIACFGVLAINLGLLGRFGFRLSGSREVAFLAILLAAYHAWFVDLYYSTGTVYDLLSYCFYLGAFNFYLGVRERKVSFSWRHAGTLAVLYICALNAKEMAVTLPVMLAAYEVIYHMRPIPEYRGVLVTALVTVPYVFGKLRGAGSLVEVPSYRLTVSPGRYLDTFHLYLNPLLYQEHVFRDPNTIQLVIAMLAVALLLRSKPLLFAWCFVLISLLPVAFIAHYAGFFLYLPMAGWALYAAVLLVTVRRLLLARVRSSALRVASAVALPVAVALFLAPQHRRETAKTLRIFQSVQPPSSEIATQLTALRPRLPRGARVLFVGDPFPQSEYFLYFLTRLLYRDMSIAVEKAPLGGRPPGDERYDAVFTLEQGRLTVSPTSWLR
jgi:hypothetical protein